MTTPSFNVEFERYYGSYDTYSFNVKGGEKFSISNLSKKSYKVDDQGKPTKERKYQDNILYAGEKRLTWTGKEGYYSYNTGNSNYTFNPNDYLNTPKFWTEDIKNNYESFGDFYYSNQNHDSFIKSDKAKQAKSYNTDDFKIDIYEFNLLKEIVNSNKNDGENTLSQSDLAKFYRDWKANKNVEGNKYEALGITNIVYDGINGIYRIDYTQENQEYDEETNTYVTTSTENKNLVFDYVIPGETQTIEDYEMIGRKLRELEKAQVREFSDYVENWENPHADRGFDWITPIKNFFKNLF